VRSRRFRWAGDAGLEKLYRVKLLTVLGTILYIFIVFLINDVPNLDWRLAPNMPIYYNIRHLNIEIAFVVMIGAIFWLVSPSQYDRTRWILFILLGYVSFWTAGRGQIIAFYLFLGLLAYVQSSRGLRFKTLKPLVAFTLGALICGIVNPELVAWLFGRSTAGSADQIAAGRIAIWIKCLELTISSWWSVAFGLGPDAYVRYQILKFTSHPHNSVIQFFLEFGLVGLSGLFTLIMMFVKGAARVYKGNPASPTANGVAAALAALLLYSFTDGIFYHASPLMMSMLLIAFVLSKDDTFQMEPVNEHLKLPAARGCIRSFERLAEGSFSRPPESRG
jgi:O-antigen ligase